MRGGDLTPLSSGGWSAAGNRIGPCWGQICHGGARREVGCWFVAGVALRRGRVDIVRCHWRRHRDGGIRGEGFEVLVSSLVF